MEHIFKLALIMGGSGGAWGGGYPKLPPPMPSAAISLLLSAGSTIGVWSIDVYNRRWLGKGGDKKRTLDGAWDKWLRCQVVGADCVQVSAGDNGLCTWKLKAAFPDVGPSSEMAGPARRVSTGVRVLGSRAGDKENHKYHRADWLMPPLAGSGSTDPSLF